MNLFIQQLFELMKNLMIKKTLEKIVLVEVQKDIYPNIEKTLLNLLYIIQDTHQSQ